MAVGKTYAEARRKHGDSELLDDLVSSPPTLDRSRVRSAGDISDVSSERLREAVVLLKQKASPEEVETYKGFALTLAESAAHAHREGGRMGVGGEQVSESEQEALHEIAASLQLGPPSRHCGQAPASWLGTPQSGYAAGIWLWSVGAAVSLSGAFVGAALALTLIDLSPPLAVLIGAAAGWVLASLVLGAAAERLDRRLHRMGGGGAFRRRRR